MASKAGRRARVIHVVPFLGKDGSMGGGVRMAVDLVKALARTGACDVTLCSLSSEDTWWSSYGLKDKPRFLQYGGWHRNPAETWRCVRALRQVVRETAPDIVHSYLWLADLVSSLAAPPGRWCRVAHLQDTRTWMASSHPSARIRRAAYRAAVRPRLTWFIACADAVKTHVVEHLGLPEDRIRVIRNTVDVAVWACPPRPPRQDGLVLGTSGRLQPEKGYDLFLRSLALLKRRGLAFEARIAGSGSLLGSYQKLSADLGIADRVRFLGRLPNMREFYQALDLYVQPSVSSEGLPLSILEAMSSGLAVVATRVAGAAEAVRDGEDGLLVDVAKPEPLASAIERLARDPVLRGRMAEHGRARAEALFSLETMAADTLQFYDELLHPAGG